MASVSVKVVRADRRGAVVAWLDGVQRWIPLPYLWGKDSASLNPEHWRPASNAFGPVLVRCR